MVRWVPEATSEGGLWRTGIVVDTLVALKSEIKKAGTVPARGIDYLNDTALPEVSLMSAQDFRMLALTMSGMGT